MNGSDTKYEDELLKLLQDTAPEPVPDDGFTEALMKRLPQTRSASPKAVWLGLASGVVLTVWQLQGNPLLSQLADDWLTGQFSLLSMVVLGAVMLTAFSSSFAVLTK
jgi:hypothetical protein